MRIVPSVTPQAQSTGTESARRTLSGGLITAKARGSVKKSTLRPNKSTGQLRVQEPTFSSRGNEPIKGLRVCSAERRNSVDSRAAEGEASRPGPENPDTLRVLPRTPPNGRSLSHYLLKEIEPNSFLLGVKGRRWEVEDLILLYACVY